MYKTKVPLTTDYQEDPSPEEYKKLFIEANIQRKQSLPINERHNYSNDESAVPINNVLIDVTDERLKPGYTQLGSNSMNGGLLKNSLVSNDENIRTHTKNFATRLKHLAAKKKPMKQSEHDKHIKNILGGIFTGEDTNLRKYLSLIGGFHSWLDKYNDAIGDDVVKCCIYADDMPEDRLVGGTKKKNKPIKEPKGALSSLLSGLDARITID